MTDSTVSRMPPELVDEIIDRLGDDATTLKTCTTVSRAWITRSRFHLFSRLRARAISDSEFAAFADFLKTAHDAHHSKAQRCSVVDAGLSGVRVLRLDGKSFGLKPLLTLGTLYTIVRALPNLRELHLTTVRLDDADLVSCIKPIALDALSLVSVDAHSPASAGAELLAVLSLFTRIGSLFLRFVHFNHYPPTHADAQTHPVLLAGADPHFPAKLEVDNLRLHLPRHTAFFLELFKRTPTRHTLRSLRVTSRTTEKFEAIGAFCTDADIARSLERLEVDLKFCIPQNVTDIPLLCAIDHLRALREVTLSGLCLALNTVSVDFNIFGIIHPLISAAPPSTTKFTVVLLLMEPPEDACRIFERDASDPYTTSQWEHLQDAVLSRGTEGCMALDVVFRSPFFALGVAGESIVRIEDCIKREMGTLNAQRLLTLRFEEDYNF